MIRRTLATAALAATLGLSAGAAMAHTPLFSCYDNYDGTVLCEGGFSDGSSAAGVGMSVIQDGSAVITGAMDQNSEFTFTKPDGDFTVRFDAGPGHELEMDSADIE